MLAYFGSYHWVILVSKIFGIIIFRSGQFSVNLSSIFQSSIMASLVQNAAEDRNLSTSCSGPDDQTYKDIKPDLKSISVKFLICPQGSSLFK